MTLTASRPEEADRAALLQVAQQLALDNGEALRALVQLAAKASDAPQAGIHLVDAHTVWTIAQVGGGPKQASRADALLPDLARCGASLVVRDLSEAPLSASQAAQAARQGLGALVSVQLVVDGLVMGHVSVSDTQARSWSDGVVSMLQDVATTAAALIASHQQLLRARKNEERVCTAGTAGSDWLWETDADSVLQWVSASVKQHTGMDPSAQIGKKISDVVFPRDDETRASWERYKLARQRHEPFQDMIVERDTPKGRLTVCISGTPIFDAEGLFKGYRGASRNVTRQLEAEQAARRADQLLRRAIESFYTSIMITDPQGNVVLGNRLWRDLVGEAFDATCTRWPDIMRRMAHAGCYPDCEPGSEDAFVAWRLGLRGTGQAAEMRFKERWLLVRDDALDDGCTVHFAMDITQSRQDADLLQEQQQALQATQARLSAVLQALPDLWFVIGADNRYVAAHLAHPQFTGNPAELIGHPVGTHLPDVVADLHQGAVDIARRSGRPQTIHYDLQTSDGELHHHEARLTPMPDGQVLFLSSDITDRKLAAEKLRVSEELYRSVAASIRDGLLIVDLAGRVVAMNPAATRILGMSPTVAPSMADDPRDFILLDEDLFTPLPRSQWPLQETIATGQRVIDRIVPARRADHEIVWLQMSSNLLRVDPQTPPFAAMATFRDITQERQAVQELAISEERWKFALEGAGDGVWDWDMLSGAVYYSTRWKHMLGYEDHEISDTVQELFSRVHPQDRDIVSHSTMEYVTENNLLNEVEFRLRHRQGHYLHILSRGRVVERSRDGSPLRVVGTHSDISRFKEAEEARRAQHVAESASAAKSEFLSRMSHEIRTPLNAITGFAQLLRLQMGSDESDAGRRTYVEQILHAGKHLSGLVNDVLDLQQVEAGVMTLRQEPVRLDEEIVQCLSMLLPMAEQREITMSSDIGPDDVVMVDRQRLRQVLMNIGSNAIKYNRHGGSVVVRTQRSGPNAVELSLTDSGTGMTQDQLDRLFQPFERLGRETSNIEGTGLGLIITRSLIESMGGRMEIDSRPGHGTRVSITLPGASMSAGAPEGAPSTDDSHAVSTQIDSPVLTPPVSAPSSQQPLRVLYVEDNRINALLFAEALRPHSQLELDVAEDGEIALSLARERPPEVLVLDAHLPGMSGFEVLEALRQVPGLEHVPAYMCSADAMPEDLARAKAAGFAGYWTKPIDIVSVTTELCRLAQRGDNAAP